LSQKKFDKAVECSATQFKSNLNRPMPTTSGRAYLQIKKGSLAVRYLNEAIRLDPKGKAEVCTCD
jgi:hypothetical protein